MLSKLKELLAKINRFGVIGDREIDAIIKELQRILISSDVDVDLVFELSKKLKQRAKKEKREGVTKKELLIKILYEELVNILGEEKQPLEIKPQRILLIGLFGSGKTTSCAKLAFWFKNKGLKPGLICCDTFRAAAYQQLKQLAEKIQVPFFGIEKGRIEEIITKGLEEFERKKVEVVIVDSAGRNALDKEMIEEIKKIKELLKPDEILLVIPAELGQQARAQAEEFKKHLDITGVIVTKMDSSAKGGAALTSCKIANAKVKFIGEGEKIEDFREYDPKRFVSRLLGFGDLESLLEKFKVDEEKTKEILEGKFDMNTFSQQIQQIQSFGSLRKLLEHLPGFGFLKLPEELIDLQEEKIKKWKYIIDSMTPEERANPEIIKGSRIERIAKGSGTSVQEVNELLSAYKQLKKFVKVAKPGKLKRIKGFENLFRMFKI